MEKADRSWEYYGENDPYYGVCTEQKYQRDHLTGIGLEEFFKSGERHVDSLVASIRQYIDPSFEPKRALDFGCGVGRVLISLARVSDWVVGVDVSRAMLQEAEKNCSLQGVENVEFVLSDDALTRVSGTFDLVHSFIVFQHIPRKRGEQIFRKLVRMVGENGVGALHVVYDRQVTPVRKVFQWARRSLPLVNNLANIALRQPLQAPLIPMYTYKLEPLLRALQDEGCDRLFLQLGMINSLYSCSYGAMIYFRKHGVASD